MYFAELKSSQIATWRSNRTWHQRCLCSCFVSWKQVAAIRGSIMGAGISLVAAMDYVVAPESRSLRWAWAGVWNPIGKLMYSIKHIKLKALNRFEKKAHSRLISSVLTSVQDIQNATSNCREMAWNGDSGYLWMDLMTWYDLVMIWYDLWWLYRFYQIYDMIFMDFPVPQLLFQLHWLHHGFTTFGGTVPGGPSWVSRRPPAAWAPAVHGRPQWRSWAA